MKGFKMRKNISYFIYVLSILLLPSLMYSQVPYGEEFLVNTSNGWNHTFPTIGRDSTGNYVIAWDGFSGSDRDIYAQKFDPIGNKIGNQILVNSRVLDDQFDADIAVEKSGDFVVVWESKYPDTLGWDIVARLFNSDGTPKGPEFIVNTFRNRDQVNPVVEYDKKGNFVIAWESNGQDTTTVKIYYQKFDNTGSPIGTETLLITNTAIDKSPHFSFDSKNDMIMVWQGATSPVTFIWDVFGRRFDTDLNPVGNIFKVNTYTTLKQREPKIDFYTDDSYLIVWQSEAQDGDIYGIYGQKRSANDNNIGSEFLINTYTIGRQDRPDLDIDNSNYAVVVWESRFQDGDGYGIFAQRFDENLNPYGSEFQVNRYSTNDQRYPVVAIKNKGDFVIAYQSFGQNTAGKFEIYARAYKMSPVFSDLPQLNFNEDNQNKIFKSYFYLYVNDENDPDSTLIFGAVNSTHLAAQFQNDTLTIIPENNWFGTDSFSPWASRSASTFSRAAKRSSPR